MVGRVLFLCVWTYELYYTVTQLLKEQQNNNKILGYGFKSVVELRIFFPISLLIILINVIF